MTQPQIDALLDKLQQLAGDDLSDISTLLADLEAQADDKLTVKRQLATFGEQPTAEGTVVLYQVDGRPVAWFVTGGELVGAGTGEQPTGWRAVCDEMDRADWWRLSLPGDVQQAPAPAEPARAKRTRKKAEPKQEAQQAPSEPVEAPVAAPEPVEVSEPTPEPAEPAQAVSEPNTFARLQAANAASRQPAPWQPSPVAVTLADAVATACDGTVNERSRQLLVAAASLAGLAGDDDLAVAELPSQLSLLDATRVMLGGEGLDVLRALRGAVARRADADPQVRACLDAFDAHTTQPGTSLSSVLQVPLAKLDRYAASLTVGAQPEPAPAAAPATVPAPPRQVFGVGFNPANEF